MRCDPRHPSIAPEYFAIPARHRPICIASVLTELCLCCPLGDAGSATQMAKRNSKRGAHLRGVGNPTVGTKRTAVQLDGSDSDIDPSFDPEDADDADALLTLPPDVVPEEAEPGAKRDAHRQAVLAAQGAAGLQRLDKQAARQRRARRNQAAAEDQTSIEDATDGTLLAKKVALELEPEDAWVGPAVADAEAVAVDGDGQRLVVLGEPVAVAAQGTPAPAVEQTPARPKRGRPPGSTANRTSLLNSSHRGLAPGSTANRTSSKAAHREMRAAASAAAVALHEAAEAMAGGAPGEPPAKRRADADVERGPQLLPKLLHELRPLADRLCVIASARRFQRSDFIDGELLSHGDWVELRESSWELRRVYAMAHFVGLQRRGVGVVAACTQAAEAVRLGKKADGMTMRAVHHWLSEYIRNEGRIASSRRGCNTKTESFLSDESIKETALAWLRTNVRAAQQKGSTEPPLNVPR